MNRTLNTTMMQSLYQQLASTSDPLADVDREFTLADVTTEAQNRSFTMDDLEEMSIQIGY